MEAANNTNNPGSSQDFLKTGDQEIQEPQKPQMNRDQNKLPVHEKVNLEKLSPKGKNLGLYEEVQKSGVSEGQRDRITKLHTKFYQHRSVICTNCKNRITTSLSRVIEKEECVDCFNKVNPFTKSPGLIPTLQVCPLEGLSLIERKMVSIKVPFAFIYKLKGGLQCYRGHVLCTYFF